MLEPADLALPGAEPLDSDMTERAVRLGAPISLAALEREHIARVVAQAPSLEAAARILGIDTTTLQRKRNRYGSS